MDDVSIHLESLVVDGGAALDEDRMAMAIRAQAGEALSAGVLVHVSRAVVESIKAAPGVHIPQPDSLVDGRDYREPI